MHAPLTLIVIINKNEVCGWEEGVWHGTEGVGEL